MSEKKGPQLKSLPDGLHQSEPLRRRPVSDRSPTAKLPNPPPPVPIPTAAPNAPPPLPLPSESAPPSKSAPPSPQTTGEFAAVHPLIRKQFGRYELLMQLGSGGMATLFLARINGPQKFEKLLAIKKIHDHLLAEKDFVAMFRDEARIAALIHHPNVVATFDLGVIENSYFIAMEYVHGQTVKDLMNAGARREDPLHWSYAVRIASEVAKGLHAAHTLHSHTGEALKVIHRDVSPQNILVSYDGHVKLVDFGIAYAAEKLSHTDAGKLKGKLSYMSPEQVSGKPVDHRSDIFSLGTVLFELITQRRLFKESNDASTLLKVRAARVPDLQHFDPKCPPELDALVRKALARDPEDRFPTAEAFAEALDELLVATKTRVGRQQVAGMMEDLFFERKRLKDRMRRRALTNLTNTPIQGIEAIADGTASLLMPRVSTSTADDIAPKGRTGIIIAGMAGGLLVLAILVAVLLMRPEPPKPAREKPAPVTLAKAAVMTAPRPVVIPRQPPVVRRPPAVASVMLTIRVLPKDADASIKFRNEVQKGSIFQAALPTSTSREEVTVTAAGYLPRVIPIVLSQALTLPVELVADPALKRRPNRHGKRKRPRARPMSKLLDL